jgi:hypothetical protein
MNLFAMGEYKNRKAFPRFSAGMVEKNRGFTLIELIMIILLMGVISIVLGRFLLAGYQLLITSQHIENSDWAGFLVLERLTNDIHQINAASSLTVAQANSLTFLDTNGATIQYTFSGNTLMRNNTLLANNLSQFIFSYRNASGAVTTVTSAIRYITVAFTTTNIPSVSFSCSIGTRI